MRYECVYCGQGGASGADNDRPPATYNCHGCGRKGSMYPYEPVRQLKEAKVRIVELEQRCEMLSRVKRVSRDSDMSVTVTFGSCAEASRFEEMLKDA